MQDLREVMRKWTTGVSIVTAMHRGKLHGMTVNSLASLSIDPPIVAVTMANLTRTLKFVKNSGCFGVTLLARRQQDLSDWFAGKVPEASNRYAGVEVIQLTDQISTVKDGLGYLGCKLIHTYAMPNSTLVIAEVVVSDVISDEPPLVHFDREYHGLED